MKLVNEEMKVSPIGIEPPAHRLKVRPNKTDR